MIEEQIRALAVAREFAVRAHGDQKYGDLPYSVHIDEVVAIVTAAMSGVDRSSPSSLSVSVGCDPWLAEAAVGFLHDVLEDTAVTPAELASCFGDGVASCVILLTDPDGLSRRERKAALHDRLSCLDEFLAVHRTALVVKACDRLANLRRCVEFSSSLLPMYRREASAFREAVYRPGLCDEVWSEIDDLVRP